MVLVVVVVEEEEIHDGVVETRKHTRKEAG